MRVLVTGAFGFMGGRLSQHLLSVGHQVLLGSRVAHETPDWCQGAHVVKTDWNDEPGLRSVCRSMDVVIHASGMNAQDCAKDAVAALQHNGVATASLARAAAAVGVQRFIYLSTAHVYGSPLVGYLDEDALPGNLHPYATSHLAGEKATLYEGRNGMDTVILRLSNAFGRPVTEDVNCWMLLVNDLCRQAVVAGELKLQTSGMQMRDFVPISEVCRLVENLLGKTNPRSPHSLVNVGAGVSMSVREMAERIGLRCNLTLGFEPALIVPQPGLEAPTDGFSYSIARLEDFQMSMDPNPDAELDDLLRFCQLQFGKGSQP